MRESEGDPSVVSLRDVKRTLILLDWFLMKILPAAASSGNASAVAGSGRRERGGDGGGDAKISPLGRAAVLALAHVYCYRLPTAQTRHSYWCMISAVVKAEGGYSLA